MTERREVKKKVKCEHYVNRDNLFGSLPLTLTHVVYRIDVSDPRYYNWDTYELISIP